jgi:hypothetical protein
MPKLGYISMDRRPVEEEGNELARCPFRRQAKEAFINEPSTQEKQGRKQVALSSTSKFHIKHSYL